MDRFDLKFQPPGVGVPVVESKLTRDEQAIRDQEIRDSWIQFAFNGDTDVDLAATREGTDWMYRLANLPQPVMMVMDSVLGCQIAGNIMQRLEGEDWSKWGKKVRGKNAEARTFNGAIAACPNPVVARHTVGKMLESLRDPVNMGLALGRAKGTRFEAPLRMLLDTLDETIECVEKAEVNATLRAFGRVFAQVFNRPFTYEHFSAVGLGWDLGWSSYYDSRRRAGELSDVKFDNWLKFVQAGVWDCILYAPVAIICRRPAAIHFNDRNMLHNPNGPAVAWADGHKSYFVAGVAVDSDIIEHPESITAERIRAERNAEVRRVMIDIMGLLKYLKESNAKVLDKDQDNSKMDRTLYQIPQTDDEDIVCVHVKCPSTGHEFMLRVPPGMKTCAEAVAWTFDIENAQDYNPLQEA